MDDDLMRKKHSIGLLDLKKKRAGGASGSAKGEKEVFYGRVREGIRAQINLRGRTKKGKRAGARHHRGRKVNGEFGG